MSETILDRIFAHKRTEVARQQLKVPLERIKAQAQAAPPARDFAAALQKGPGTLALIAEVKKASPSKGVLIENFEPTSLAHTYAEHGAAAISVLTDVRFFQGHLSFLRLIREHLYERGYATPLLRKDFIFDPYQVYEARAYGADAILLIVAMLSDQQLQQLHDLAVAQGMTALVEVHTLAELQRAQQLQARVVGVNNRNLHTFEVRLETTQQLAASLPPLGHPQRPILVAESGISSSADLAALREWQADAILVGESLVVAPDTAQQVRLLSGA